MIGFIVGAYKFESKCLTRVAFYTLFRLVYAQINVYIINGMVLSVPFDSRLSRYAKLSIGILYVLVFFVFVIVIIENLISMR